MLYLLENFDRYKNKNLNISWDRYKNLSEEETEKVSVLSWSK